jgi:hypothetical protein
MNGTGLALDGTFNLFGGYPMKKSALINNYFLTMEQLANRRVEGKLYLGKKLIECASLDSFETALWWGKRCVYHWTNEDPIERSLDKK